MKTQLDKSYLEKIRSLPILTPPVEITALSGGITNNNYRVNDDGSSYFVRISEEQPLLGIDRQNELLCAEEGSKCGIAPKLVYSEPGIMVTDFIEGRVLTPEDIHKRETMERIVDVLKVVHGIGSHLTGEALYFSSFQTVRTYAQRVRQLGVQMPAGLDEALDESQRFERKIGPFFPTLCHNDVLAANWIDDGARMWLVDWEYAGVGNPMFDLANLSANFRFTTEMDEELLRCYHGDVTAKAMQELKVIKTVSLLREVLWALIQTAISDLDFDYHQYAADNLELYYAARKDLGGL